AIQGLPRYIICSRISKRSIFDFVATNIVLSDKIQAFVFSDDYSFGILQSKLHWIWWLERGATLKSDPSYTPHSIFDTFPWPQQPIPAQVKAVAEAGRNLHEYRRGAMRRNPKLTLREMYRSLELPGKNPLKDLHTALDAAVLAAYGFGMGSAAGARHASPQQEDDALLQGLLALNGTVAARLAAGERVTAPGVPADYPTPADLVSEGCIQPPELI
ncbi:MAG: type IIL restriction-modification enzyme MmeI, partial [bacterium]|nr:type IIL restriction-modification enzyme MmeI [bacterium]